MDAQPAAGDKEPAAGDKEPAAGDKEPAAGDIQAAAGDIHAWLATDVAAVPGVSGRTAATLRAAFDIRTVRDLLEHYPHADRYRDLGAPVALADAQLGEVVTLLGTVTRWDAPPPKTRRPTKAVIGVDGGGTVEAAFFNQPWMPKRYPAGARVAASGTLDRFRSVLQLKGARLVDLEGAPAPEDDDWERIVPTYPATEALPSPRVAAAVRAALEELPPLPDPLPDVLRAQRGLMGLDTALRTIHRPRALSDVAPARARLVYDELLTLQLGLQQRRQRLEADEVGLVCPPVERGLAPRFLDELPFTPTPDQLTALAEIGGDLARPRPMHRLLQGDVGTGKTLVAAWAMLRALDAGHQAVLMAPTSILAEQHLRTFSELLRPLGVGMPGGPRVELLVGGLPAARLRGLLAEVAVGDVGLLIGTHALLEERVRIPDLGVVVIDEQHRFGVEHRARLRDKRDDGRSPDVLVMTATPIPRSLALTVYGDLDVTELKQRPHEVTVRTTVLPSASPRRGALYDFVRERVAAGERAYVVCPLVEESEALRVAGGDDGDRSLASALEVHRRLAEEVFPDLRVGLVHGRMPAAERDAAMDAFRDGATPILVATTVIEVGVSVDEATVMIVEDADRFGISQLHQLRGRLYRGLGPNHCVLFSASEDAGPRLQALAGSEDGFALAEVDLELRGEGSLFDIRQSGLPDLKLARLARDRQTVIETRRDAGDLVAADPDLRSVPLLAAEVRRRWGDQRLATLEAH